jgi:hypothetical protein
MNFCWVDLVEGLRRTSLGLDNYRYIRAIIDLTSAVCVTEIAAVLVRMPLILEGLTGLYWSLCKLRNTVGPGCICLVDA